MLALKKPFAWQYQRKLIRSPRQNIDQLCIGTSVPGQLDIRWRNTATGLLIVKKTGTPPAFFPTDGQTYNVGENVGDGEVVFIGVTDHVSDAAPCYEDTVYYKAFAYNAGNDQIRYYQGDVCEGSVTANKVDAHDGR